MEFAELKSLFDKIGDIPIDDFIQLATLGYLRARRYSDQLPDAAPEKEVKQFIDYATELHLECGLFANILAGHLAITFKDEEPSFHCTAVGKRYVEENILRESEDKEDV